MVGLPDFRSHSKSGPFANQPLFDHSKSRLVQISDLYCTVAIWITKDPMLISFKMDFLKIPKASETQTSQISKVIWMEDTLTLLHLKQGSDLHLIGAIMDQILSKYLWSRTHILNSKGIWVSDWYSDSPTNHLIWHTKMLLDTKKSSIQVNTLLMCQILGRRL